MTKTILYERNTAMGYVHLSIDESILNGFESIQITCRVKSDAPVEKLQQLCNYAQKRSPVFDIVTHETPVTVKLDI